MRSELQKVDRFLILGIGKRGYNFYRASQNKLDISGGDKNFKIQHYIYGKKKSLKIFHYEYIRFICS